MTGPVLEVSNGRLIDLRRNEDESCERLTPGCPIAHMHKDEDPDGSCETW